MEFIAPVANQYNAHLSNSQMRRLQNIFGERFKKRNLKVKCGNPEVEFCEVQLGSLIICYFHNISERGFRIRFYASNGNLSSSGEYGAMKEEYTPILDNVGEEYLRPRSAKIIEWF